MNIFRKLLIKKLEENGGYHARHDSYAIKYEVGLYYADTDIDHLAKVAAEHHGLDLKLFELVRDNIEWDENQQWDWAQETMTWLLDDSDCYSTYGTDTAKMFGLPYERFPRQYKRRSNEMAFYPAAKGGWMLEDPYINHHFKVKFGLAGRGGKHLVITEFEGYELNISNRELIEYLEDEGEAQGFSNEWCRNLLAMMREWEKCFTSKLASEELEWRMADQLVQKVKDYVEEPNQVKDESGNHIDDGDRQQRGEPTPSEAVYAFAAWLTTRDQDVTIGSTQNAAIVAELVSLFVASQGWESPRDDYIDHLRAYPSEAPQPTTPAQQYYYKVTGCKADKATAPDCICWHDKGTGPFPERKEGDRPHGVKLIWRDKPQPDEPFCVDEGCPHHGTKHICINRHAEPVKVPSDDEIIDAAISSGLSFRDSSGDVLCAWREDADISGYLIENARALLARYGSKS